MSADQEPAVDHDPGLRECRATVVLAGDAKDGEKESRYAMYSAREVTPDGAFLATSLLLELGEEVTLELALGSDTVRTDARVVALETGDASGMTVEFSGLDDSDRQLILDQFTRSSEV